MILMQETLHALCRAALRRPFLESAKERDDLGAGYAAPYRAAFHRPVVESSARYAHNQKENP